MRRLGDRELGLFRELFCICGPKPTEMAAGHPVDQYGLLWVYPLLDQSSFPHTHPTWNGLFFDRNLRYFRTCAVGAKRLSQDLLFIDLRECFGDISTGRAHAIVAKKGERSRPQKCRKASSRRQRLRYARRRRGGIPVQRVGEIREVTVCRRRQLTQRLPSGPSSP